MTEGLEEALSTTAEDVAADTVKAWKAGKEVVYPRCSAPSWAR